MIRETPSRETRPCFTSFRTTWGVDTTIFDSRHRSSRSSGAATSPVNTAMRSGATVSVTLRVAACCSTRGFVGAKKRTRPPWVWRISAMTRAAMTVLPMPVGRTTSVDRCRQEVAMFR